MNLKIWKESTGYDALDEWWYYFISYLFFFHLSGKMVTMDPELNDWKKTDQNRQLSQSGWLMMGPRPTHACNIFTCHVSTSYFLYVGYLHFFSLKLEESMINLMLPKIYIIIFLFYYCLLERLDVDCSWYLWLRCIRS